jgi:hypothetical protein
VGCGHFVLSDSLCFEERARIEFLEDGRLFLIHFVFGNERRESKPDSTTSFFYHHFLNNSNYSTSKEKEKPTWKSKQVSLQIYCWLFTIFVIGKP